MNASTDAAEIAVIGILLRNPDEILHNSIDERWFSRYRHIIRAMLKIAGSGEEIDIFTIAEALGSSQKFVPELHRIKTNEFAALSNLPVYLKKLQSEYTGTQVIMSLRNALSELESGSQVDAVMSQLMQGMLKTMSTDQSKHEFTMREAMGAFMDELEKTYDARDQGGIGLKTGLRDLDKYLGGLHPSDLCVIGARPGMGKTAWMTTVMLNLAKHGKRGRVISSEMSASQLALRYTSSDSSVAGHKLRDANLGEDDWTELTKSINRLAEFDIRIFDKSTINIAEIAMQAKAWAIDGGIDYLMIDYLQRIRPVKSQGSRNIDVGEITKCTKDIARQLKIPVILLSQLNRESEIHNRRPIMSDLRDSGEIEAEADQILFLWRNEEDLTEAEILIDKNRHGESKTVVPCYFDTKCMTWKDKARTMQERYAGAF